MARTTIYVYKLDFKNKKPYLIDRILNCVETLSFYISDTMPIIFGKNKIDKAYENKIICRDGIWWMFTSNPSNSVEKVFLKSIRNKLEIDKQRYITLVRSSNYKQFYIDTLCNVNNIKL